MYLYFYTFTLDAQYHELSLNDKVNNSELIIEGRVISKLPYQHNGRIYTAFKVEVNSIIKSRFDRLENTIRIVTYGGSLNGEFENHSHSLKLSVGMEGLFFLKNNLDIAPTNDYYFTTYGAEQGFIKYYLDENWDLKASGLFTTITNIDNYINQINQISGSSLTSSSRIVKNKSGATIKLDDIDFNLNGDVTISTSLKGHWSKDYNVEELVAKILFNSPTLVTANTYITSTPIVQSNYNWYSFYKPTRRDFRLRNH